MYPILISALVVGALVVAALSAALIADSGKLREFDLPEKHDREDIINASARLAVMPPSPHDIRGDILLARKYINRAFAVVGKKTASSAECDGYEKRFADNYSVLRNAVEKVSHSMSKLVRASSARRANIVELAENIVRSNAGITDKDLVRSCVNAFCAKTPLPYSELRLLGDALRYALIKQFTVYASKIIYRFHTENKARADARQGRISEKYVHSLSYVKTLYEFSDTKGKHRFSEYCLKRGRNVYTAAANDARVLACYCGGIDALTDSLRADFIDAEFISELSASGKIYERGCDSWKNITVGTRTEYLRLTEKLSVKRKESESAVAAHICELARKNNRDISEYLIPEPSNALAVLSLTAAVVSSVILSACVILFLPTFIAVKIAFAVLLLPITFKCAFIICDEIAMRAIAHRTVPEMRLKTFPSTALIICAAVSRTEDIVARYRDILTLLKANDNENFSYGLVLDCIGGYDVAEASKAVCSLVHGTDDRVFVCLRRKANERKRGALIDFNNLVLYGNRTPFALILGAVKKFRYAVTLDSDSKITDAERLVSIMEHPYNARYAIGSLSMRASTAGLTTPFSRLFGGEKGLSSYSASKGIYFNACDFACYTGKGIYRIKETNEAVADAFPDNRILSHDMIEGALAGCCDTGICGTDEFPETPNAYLARAERWMRGDLQLLPYLGRRSKNKYGRQRGKGVCFAAKLVAIRNAVDVFVPICALLILFLSLLFECNIMLLAAFLPELLATVFACVLMFGNPLSFLACAARNTVRAMLLPTVAFVSIKAVAYVVACIIRKNGFLKWQTYSSSLRGMFIYPANLCVSVIFAVITPFFGFKTALFALFFIFGICISALLSRKKNYETLPSEEREFAVDLAKKTWEYFCRSLCAFGKYLPSDNYSDEKGWADRTSPTNIGMALCAAVCACEFKFISESERAVIVKHIFDETDRLEKYRGCLYNWYSVNDGTPLPPKYVSSVDCGNFLAALMVIRACVPECADRAEAMIESADMSFLQGKNGLLHIGYNVDSGKEDCGLYDLLGSESALTYLTLIACGKSDKQSYFALSRRSVKAGRKRMLASWSGGAFEYLLPLLFFRAPEYSLLGKSAFGTLYAQKKYASRSKSEIWGASESLYGEKYENGDLKYRAFGVPEISLSSDPERKVFAPYASVMYFGAVSRKKSPLKDMLEKYVCEYGLYDSVDCVLNKVQKSAMSHHQGMIMLSLCTALCEDAVRNKLLDDAGIRAASLLLDEDASALNQPEKRRIVNGVSEIESRGYYAGGRSRYPQLNFMTDGNYCLITDEFGRNFSMADGLPLTRFDKLCGLRVFVRGDVEYEPSTVSDCFHGVNYSEYISHAQDGMLSIKYGLLFGENAEIRRIRYENTTDRPIVMSVIAGAKPTLCPINADISHKAFSSMFIETRKSKLGEFVFARRTNTDSDKVLALFADKPSILCGDERYARTHKGVRFGRTTEPWLGLESELIVPSHGEAELNIVMSYGTEKDVAILLNKISDISFADYSLKKSAAYSEAYFSAQARILGAILLCGGKRNGVPYEIVVRADDDTSGAAVCLLDELERLSSIFGLRFSVAVTGNLPYSYSDCRRVALLEAAARLGEKCRIVDELTDTEIKFAEERLDAFDCKNILLPPFCEKTSRPLKELPLRLPKTVYKLGIGGFTASGGYLVDEKTPSPWYNVISDGKIGCITSDIGGYTFGKNSRQEKYTRHTNDELNDSAGDGVVLGEGGTLWSVTRSPLEKNCRYAALHDSGYSVYYCGYNGLYATQKVFVSKGVKYIAVTLENPFRRKRVIDLMYFAELVMGDFYRECAAGIKCGGDDTGIYAVNEGMKLYLNCSEPARSTAFFAESYRDGTGKVRVCTDFYNDGMTPALAYSCRITVEPKGTSTVVFALSEEYTNVSVSEVLALFDKTVSDFRPKADIECDGIMGCYVKRLFYQTYAARYIARCGFQQVSGAIGFRDRLQDSVSLIGAVPDDVREFLIECASHQFAHGDVMHWWHEPYTGVRTHICDDKLFLPYAAVEYVERTGDESVLAESAYYLADKKIPHGEHSVYACMEQSEEKDTLRGHIMRAFRSVELSERGLVLMGTGDWNDGMDKVGENGRGESVWCSMFAYYVAGRFLPYADESDRVYLAELRRRLKAAVALQKRGLQYVRAYDDNGDPIGTEENKECRIDLLVQSWAVLSGLESGDEAKRVLGNAYEKLYDKEHKLIKLLDPPITDKRIGYIADYPQGVRENGGQYTHAAVWFIRALYEAGMNDKANELLYAILPNAHTASKSDVETYLKEPYVIAGDVYSGELAGRGGWTWYTGAAGWLYRVITENYYGVIIRRGAVRFAPGMPVGESAKLTVRPGNGSFGLEIDGTESGDWHLSIDGIEYGVCKLPVTSLAGRTVKLKRRKNVD